MAFGKKGRGIAFVAALCAGALILSEKDFSFEHLLNNVSELKEEKLAGISAKENDELLILVNRWHPLDSDYTPELTALSDGTQVDKRCVQELITMLEDCNNAGFSPYICSAYRTIEKQQELYDNKVQRLINDGWPEHLAQERAATEVARPGTSEHHLGLALDIIDSGYTVLDEEQENTPTQRWLIENSWKYGFILRYPEGKSEVTGIIYEPWHYRYVGMEAAAAIHRSGLCLEEYLESIGN